MKKLAFFVLMIIGALGVMCAQTRRQDINQQHVQWVADSLKEMEAVKPGMTRADLLKIFTIEGGLSSRLLHTYVSRQCLYFKVDVQFEAVGPTEFNDRGNDTGESNADKIVKISRPYLQFSVAD